MPARFMLIAIVNLISVFNIFIAALSAYEDDMKYIAFKNNKTLAAISALSLFGYAGIAFAHDYGGTLGKTAAATDFFQVSCFDDGAGPADRLFVQVREGAPTPGPLVNVQVITGITAKNTTDPTNGNATYSPGLNVKAVNGTYYLLVDKTKAGTAPTTYTLTYHCLTSTGDHTGTTEVTSGILQNQ